MTEQTETERNEAIKVLEHMRDNNLANYEIGNYEDKDIDRTILKEIKALDLAISALKQQSEAERRIERVREYCENAIGEELYSLPHTEKEIMYIEMKQAVANYIIEILEGS